jgi:hypothetical protein
MLHGAITPLSKSCLKNGGMYTFTIVDSLQSMVTLVKDLADFEPTLERQQAVRDKFKSYPTQPFVLVVGESYEQIKLFYCVTEGIKYKCRSFIHALDLCYKTFFVFNIEYPSPSYFAWVFLEKHIYNMRETKKISSKVNILNNKFNNE